jgi:hypothetical protein
MATQNSVNIPTTVNTLPYGNGTGFSAISAANNSVLVTNGSGVPSLGTSVNAGFTFGGSAPGTYRVLNVQNTDNTNAGSHATFVVNTGGSSGGQPAVNVSVASTIAYAWGIDTTASNVLKEVTGASNSVLPASGTVLRQMTAAGQQTLPLQPAFRAYVTSTLSNVTGDSTVYSITSGTPWTILNQNSSNFTTGGTFTAPVSGYYSFTALMQLGGTTVATTQTSIRLVVSGTSAFTYEYDQNVVPSTGSTFQDVQIAAIAYMTAGDTAILQVAAKGTTKVVSVVGGTNVNYWSGVLMC